MRSVGQNKIQSYSLSNNIIRDDKYDEDQSY